jgi:hypothetical protein
MWQSGNEGPGSKLFEPTSELCPRGYGKEVWEGSGAKRGRSDAISGGEGEEVMQVDVDS